jgi:soluble lytic murein transglycosylase-like protein
MLAAVALILSLRDPVPPPPLFFPAPTVDGMIVRASLAHGVDPELVMRLAWRESNLRPDVVGHNSDGSHDYGALQVNDRAVPSAPRMTPEENIEAGVAILEMWLRKCHGDARCAVKSYGTGH